MIPRGFSGYEQERCSIAMHKEFDDLKKISACILNNDSYLHPSAKILPCTWDFKRKIAPNGYHLKCKA